MTAPNLLRALRGERLDAPPLWLMRQAGRYLPEYRALRAKAGGFWAMASDPVLASEVTLQPVRRFGLDAAILFSDILVAPYALGQDVAFHEGQGPVLGPVPPSLDFDLSRIDFVYDTIRRVRDALPADKALIGFAGGPWTLACYMLSGRGGDFMPARAAAWRGEIGPLMAALVETTAGHLVEQARVGADALQIFESWAGLCPDVPRWVVEPTRAVVERVRAAAPDTPIIGFPRGLTQGWATYAQTTGVDALGLDERVDAAWAAEHLQPRWPVQGNLDPACLLAGGRALDAEVRRIRAALSGGPFVFNLGHGVHKHTPPEHIHALISVLRGV